MGTLTSALAPVRRRRFQACPDQLEAAGHKGAKNLFDVVAPPLHQITGTTLLDNGRFRCAMHCCLCMTSRKPRSEAQCSSNLCRCNQRPCA